MWFQKLTKIKKCRFFPTRIVWLLSRSQSSPAPSSSSFLPLRVFPTPTLQEIVRPVALYKPAQLVCSVFLAPPSLRKVVRPARLYTSAHHYNGTNGSTICRDYVMEMPDLTVDAIEEQSSKDRATYKEKIAKGFVATTAVEPWLNSYGPLPPAMNGTKVDRARHSVFYAVRVRGSKPRRQRASAASGSAVGAAGAGGVLVGTASGVEADRVGGIVAPSGQGLKPFHCNDARTSPVSHKQRMPRTKFQINRALIP